MAHTLFQSDSKLKALVSTALVLVSGVLGSGQSITPAIDLSKMLSDPGTRTAVLDRIESDPSTRQILLDLAKSPPPEMNSEQQRELFVGLAEAFGKLREEAAISFLIEHISLLRHSLGPQPNWSLKSFDSIGQQFPCVGALRSIGYAALRAVTTHDWPNRPRLEEELAVVVVSWFAEEYKTSETKQFLLQSRGEADQMRRLANYGLARWETSK
jgi:hypothetical protein